MEVKKPKVSIVVVNYNQPKYTIDCLVSLSKISYPNTEVILIDNGSEDDSVDRLEEYIKGSRDIKFIKNSENKGFTGANNIGLKKSLGKYVLLLNNDTRVKKDFVEPLVSTMEENSSLGILQSKLLLMDKRKYLDNVASYITSFGFLYHVGYLERDNGQYNNLIKSMSAKGASFFIRKKALTLGLFDDEYFAYFEETDLCWRLWILGWEVAYEPRSIVYHKMGATSLSMKSEFIQFHSFKNRIRTIVKNASKTTLIWMLPLHIISSFLISLYFLFTGKFNIFKSIMRAYWWNIFNLMDTLNLRSKVQKSRKRTDREVFKYTFKNPPLTFYKSHLLLLNKSLK